MSRPDYPFSLINAFFIDLQFKRTPETQPTAEVPLIIEVKVANNPVPDRMQANLRIRTAPESKLEFSVEMVGLFQVENESARQDRELQTEFLEVRGIYILWAFAAQLVRIVTGQMGIKPLNIPLSLKIDLQEAKTNMFEEQPGDCT